MSVLTKTEIWEELANGQEQGGLVISPLVKGDKQIGSSSVDLHLGHEFIVFKRAKAPALDVMEWGRKKKNEYLYQSKDRISQGQKFVIHPNQLVLGASIEYISLPYNISGDIKGRSTWGRTGLIIATATNVDPGFKGCVTLELVNDGEVPLVLYPGLCVAQIVLMWTRKSGYYKGRYKYPTGPEFPDLVGEIKSLPKFYKPTK
ncbi:unnamed protein product [marine sediment metagenome]|uniref:Uncharacterized protein n=1 Tax=marine sediment metagenome TaxID=412755 RepID=X1T301_9ZZZZ